MQFKSGDYLGSQDFSREGLFVSNSSVNRLVDSNGHSISQEEKEIINHLCTVIFNRKFDLDEHVEHMSTKPEDPISSFSRAREFSSVSRSSTISRYLTRDSRGYSHFSLGDPSAKNITQLFKTIKIAAKRIFFGTNARYIEEYRRLTGEELISSRREGASITGSKYKNTSLQNPECKNTLLRNLDSETIINPLDLALLQTDGILNLRIAYLSSNLFSRFIFWGLGVAILTAKLLHRPQLMKGCLAALAVTTLFMIRQHYRFTVEEEDRVFALKLAFSDYAPSCSDIVFGHV